MTTSCPICHKILCTCPTCPRCGLEGEPGCYQEPDIGVCGGLWEKPAPLSYHGPDYEWGEPGHKT